MKKVPLTQLKAGENGIVAEIAGGIGLRRRLEVMGIREGIKLKKISTQLLRGPVSVQVGNTTVAIGFGMASRIIVQTDGEEQE